MLVIMVSQKKSSMSRSEESNILITTNTFEDCSDRKVVLTETARKAVKLERENIIKAALESFKVCDGSFEKFKDLLEKC